MFKYRVPEEKKINVIIDTDAKNEADDQYAIAHALLTPRINVLGVVATHFSKRRTTESMMQSYQECMKIMELMEDKKVDVYKGNIEELTRIDEYEVSEGARFIVEQAHKCKEPLVITSMGALTNIAAALLYDPSIGDKIKLVWIGGTQNEDTCFEANARNDYLAVNVVMERVKDLTIVPSETYNTMIVSLAELQCKVHPYGKIGKYLFEQLEEFNYVVNRPWAVGESWCLGDSCAVGYVLNERCCTVEKGKRFKINKELYKELLNTELNVITHIDTRFVLEDFFAKLVLYNS